MNKNEIDNALMLLIIMLVGNMLFIIVSLCWISDIKKDIYLIKSNVSDFRYTGIKR